MKPFNSFFALSIAASLMLLVASPAKAEMSQGAVETAKACAYVGGIGLAAGHVFEAGAVKYAAIGCGVAAGATAAYQYGVIPAGAAEAAPSENDLHQDEPAQSDQNE